MKQAEDPFAAIAALLEDMHAVALEGQVSNLSREERLSLISVLRADVEQLELRVASASKVRSG